MKTKRNNFATFAELIAHYHPHTLTPYQPWTPQGVFLLPAPMERRILVAAGVNGAGKSTLEDALPSEIIAGASAAFIVDICNWWNSLSPAEREPHLLLVSEEWRERFRGDIYPHDFFPTPEMSNPMKDHCYKTKHAFGKIISNFMQWARDPKLSILGRPGYAQLVMERVYENTLNLPNVVFSGVRPLGDWEPILSRHSDQEQIGIVFFDASQRQKDNLRGETERDLVLFWEDLLAHHTGPTWLIDSNPFDMQALAHQVTAVLPEVQAFLRLS